MVKVLLIFIVHTCIYICTHIYICIGYILYTLYLPTQTVKCVLYIYLYLHIISSNGRPKYNIMYVCIYIIIIYIHIYIVHMFWIIQDNMQMYACLHAHIRSRYWSYIADITLHYMTLPDITCHCATLHIHYMRVCTFYCIYIHKYMHLMNYTQQHLVACCQWLPSANRAPTFSVGGLEPVRDSSQNCLTL
jgi:hypothetical protein